MAQADQEERRARREELRRIRDELVRAGGYKAAAQDEPPGMLADAWAERIDGRDPASSAAARAPIGVGGGGERPLLRRLIEQRRSAGAAGSGRRSDPQDPQARRERLRRLIGRLDRDRRET